MKKYLQAGIGAAIGILLAYGTVLFVVPLLLSFTRGAVPEAGRPDAPTPIDRVLERLTPDRGYWRLGWGLVDVPDGYTPADGSGAHRPADPRPAELFVRVERETLRRFPRTNCVLFTIRTYVAAIGDVALDADARQRIATAVEVMPQAVRRYKDLAIIGEDLVRFLRSPPGSSQNLDTV